MKIIFALMIMSLFAVGCTEFQKAPDKEVHRRSAADNPRFLRY